MSSNNNRIGRIGQWDGNSNNSSSSQSGPRFATLGDLGPSGGGVGGGGNNGSDGEDGPDDEQGEGGENWFAGGERSGLSVENPARRPENNVVRDILRKAAGAAAPPPSSAGASSRAFGGAGYTLGSDEVDSTYVADPDSSRGEQENQEVVIRHLTFWRDGFSVEDGPLMRYNDPGNAQMLEEINTGHAPPHILNVRAGQPVELRVTRRLQEDYVPPPKRPMEAFEGQGHRLGETVPDSIPSPRDEPPPAQVERDSIQTRFEVDQSQPTTSLQVRLADGTRLVARMNLTHTIRDVRNFINASRPGSSSIAYTINTAYPNRVLEDESQTIEQAGLKNSVVLQRLL